MKTFFTICISVCLLPAYPVSAQSFKTQLVWQQTASVRTIAFSADGTRVITGGELGNCYPYSCGQIKIWNAADGNLINTITNPFMGQTNDVDISKDGQTIISGNGTVYCAPDGGCGADKPGQYKYAVNGSLLKSLSDPGGNVYAIQYSPDESIVASGTGYNNTGDIFIYDRNYNLLRTLSGHQYETDGLDFTPDGKYLISGGDDGLVRFWDYKTGALIRTLKHGNYFNGGTNVDVDVSPDGQLLATAGQGYNMKVKIWRISDGQLLTTIAIDGSDGYNTVRFTPDSKYVVSGLIQYGSGALGWYGRILVHTAPAGTLVKEIVDKEGSPQSGGIRTIAFSDMLANGYYFAYVVSDKLKVIQVTTAAAIAANVDNSEARNNSISLQAVAYPNPFHSATTIQYSIPNQQFVSLKIFDMYGKQVAILVNETKTPGTYNAHFNADGLTAGTYYYRLTTGNTSINKKIVLVK